jgi:hypothetical protein
VARGTQIGAPRRLDTEIGMATKERKERKKTKRRRTHEAAAIPSVVSARREKRLSDVLARNYEFSRIPIDTSASKIDRRLSGDSFKHSGEMLNSGKTAF